MKCRTCSFLFQEYHFVGEYASAVHILYQLEQNNTVVNITKLVKKFEERLRTILDEKLKGMRGCYEIMRFDDTETLRGMFCFIKMNGI